jgi:threonine/homoserine/homoserine lactone efflux protein
MSTLFLAGVALALPAVAAPGPLQALLLSLALRHGGRRALPAVLAPLLTDGPIILLVLLVLNRMPPTALQALRLAGGVVLLFFAGEALRRRRDEPLQGEASAGGAGRESLGRAILVNLLNPHPWFFWGTVGGPLLLDAWAEAPGRGLAFLAGFYLTLVGGLTVLLGAFCVLGGLSARVRRGLDLVAALALAVFGIVLLVEAGRGLL